MAKKYRQGDIVFTVVDAIPADGKQIKHCDILQMHGETGKIHELKQVQVIEVIWPNDPRHPDNATYVITPPEGAAMTHPEHPTIALPGGVTMEVKRVRTVPLAPIYD